MKRDESEPLIEYLQGLKQRKDLGALAALRRSLAFEPGEDLKVYRYVERFVGASLGSRRRAAYAAAGLFALHPEGSERSFSAAFGELVRRRVQRGNESDKNLTSAERRFLALLEADAAGVMPHLRQAVNLLATDALGYDHAGLFTDLCGLLDDHANPDWRDEIKRRWAMHFYRALQAEPVEEAEAGDHVDQ
jgi:CRISPR system Cascade subunit CasB